MEHFWGRVSSWENGKVPRRTSAESIRRIELRDHTLEVIVPEPLSYTLAARVGRPFVALARLLGAIMKLAKYIGINVTSDKQAQNEPAHWGSGRNREELFE
jgi:hypothetical protein